MDGANNSTTFRDDSLNYLGITANGNAQISTAQYKFGGASGLFDRDDTTYVGGASNSNFAFESDFTIEMWVYMIETDIGYQAFCSTHTDDNDATGWVLLLESNGNIYFYGSDGTQSGPIGGWNCQIATETSPDSEQWVHIAVVRYNNVIKIYKDGTDVTSIRNGTQTISISGGQNLEIGHYTPLPEGFKTPYCYIDELRIIKGYAAYTSNFTPANQPFPNPQISILLHMDGSNESTNFIDSSLNNFTITPYGNAQISTAQYRFGGASGYFDGIDSVLVTNDISLSTQDFTLECWAYPLSIEGTTSIFNQGNNDQTGTFTLFNYDGFIGFYANNSDRFLSSQAIQSNQWTHIAFTRQNSIYYLFINGILNVTYSEESFDHYAAPFKIGDGFGGIRHFNGYIDELRIIKGYAAYTSNFTPPTQPFPNP